MRRSQDLPIDRPRGRVSGRGILIGVGALFMFVLIFGRAIARFYIDHLWHKALDRGDVFWGVIGAKLTLFLLFFLVFAVLAGVNLFIADRTAPTSFPANVHPYVERFHEVFGQRLRLARYATAFMFAILLALPAVARWQEWLLFRNAQDFGIADQQFGVDVGFYVFQLPFLTFALDWLFVAVLLVLLLTAGAHILNGGVVLVSPVPVVRAATKAHVAALLALLAVLKAGDYWLDRYELTNSKRGIVDGATYSVVNAQIPAIMLLILIALLTAVLYLSVIKTNSWRFPLVASALWLVISIVGGVIYPAIIQGLVVNPNQEDRELLYIARNVQATQQAYGLAEVEVRETEFDDLTAAEVESGLDALDNVRLLHPTEMIGRFVFDRSENSELAIVDLDVDRYERNGEDEQFFVAALELNLAGAPNRGWQGLHLLHTHGCGLVLAPATEVTARGQRPVYQTPDLDRPELYFSPSLSGYAIANTDSEEVACNEGQPKAYEGTLGVQPSSFARRAAFALAFLDFNVIASGAINDDSQMLWVRGVNDRLEKLAPFLSYDADPYPVDLDGRVVWVVDAYTTTSRYPYSQSVGNVDLTPGSGLSANDNYVRNSVKAVVDAYTGDVTFYAMDTVDPILQAWQSVFPDLFTSLDEMPDELREHLRYPEDLFRVQTERYSKYRIAPELFFKRQGAWSIAQAPNESPNTAASSDSDTSEPAATAATSTFASEADTARFTPYYTYFDTSAEDEPTKEEFVLFRPFVEFSTDNSRTQLQSYMTASSEPETYGQLTTWIVLPGSNNQLPDGPLRVASNAESTADISLRISRDNEGGTGVQFGDLQLVPVADGLIYVRPYYVTQKQPGGQETTEYRAVIVTYNEEAVLSTTIGGALAQLFPGFDGDVGNPVVVPEEESGDAPVELTTDELLLQANDLLAQADEALADGDLGLYQRSVDEAADLVQQVLDLQGLTAEPDPDATDPDATDDGDQSGEGSTDADTDE